MPSSQESLAKGMPSSVGFRLPCWCMPGAFPRGVAAQTGIGWSASGPREREADMLSELERLAAPPAAADLEEEGLAAWEASFEHDRQIWGELLAENVDRLERGSYSLH